MNQILMMKPNETTNEYIHRISLLKEELDYTWGDLKEIIDEQTGLNLTADGYRKKALNYSRQLDIVDMPTADIEEETSSYSEKLLELKKERVKLSDERTQNNALIRRLAREDTIREIAHDVASQMNDKFRLTPVNNAIHGDESKEAILEISDWHYGIECSSFWNEYNPDIAKQRITTLRDEVIKYLQLNKIETLHIVNLGDMIAGRIHLTIRLNSRFDVITQTIEVSELIAQFLNDLAGYAKIHYYDTLDNHSRVEPNIKDSLELETLARVTTWYLKERLSDIITIHNNTYADDIISFNVLGHDVVGVHGHKDRPERVIEQMCMATQKHFDLVCTAHYHHFSADEHNHSIQVSNGSLMGVDQYAEDLRLTSRPSQNLIIVTPSNACQCIYKINLD